jgi:hypothetical protein
MDTNHILNLMGDAPTSEMEWNEAFFRDCFDNVVKVVTWISRQGNPFARHQTIVQDFIAEKKIDCGAAMLISVETRFASQVSMTERVLQQKVFKVLAVKGPGPGPSNDEKLLSTESINNLMIPY